MPTDLYDLLGESNVNYDHILEIDALAIQRNFSTDLSTLAAKADSIRPILSKGAGELITNIAAGKYSSNGSPSSPPISPPLGPNLNPPKDDPPKEDNVYQPWEALAQSAPPEDKLGSGPSISSLLD